MIDQLIANGFKVLGKKPCPRCQATIIEVEGPTGRVELLNDTDEGTEEPGALHQFFCGSNAEDTLVEITPEQYKARAESGEFNREVVIENWKE